MKNIYYLLFCLFIMTSCKNNNHSLIKISKDNMYIFENCTLLYRGIDEEGYNLYILLMTNDSIPCWSLVHTWYKDSIDYKLYIHDSAQRDNETLVTEVDTNLILNILSTASRYKIQEVHSIKEKNVILVYLQKNNQCFQIPLD